MTPIETRNVNIPEKLMLPLESRQWRASLTAAKAIMPLAMFRYVLSACTSVVGICHVLRTLGPGPDVFGVQFGTGTGVLHFGHRPVLPAISLVALMRAPHPGQTTLMRIASAKLGATGSAFMGDILGVSGWGAAGPGPTFVTGPTLTTILPPAGG